MLNDFEQTPSEAKPLPPRPKNYVLLWPHIRVAMIGLGNPDIQVYCDITEENPTHICPPPTFPI